VPYAVSIVIPTWNGQHLLEEFLPSVLEAARQYAGHAHERVEVLIVDDGSTDGTASWVRDRASSWPVPARCVRQNQNLGFGAACNRGMREAAFPLVFLLNNDVEVDASAIAPLASRFDDEGGELFGVHCRVLDFTTGQEVGTGKMGGFGRGFLRVHRSYVAAGPRRGPLYSMFASGGSAMFNRSRFLELGGFDPLFAPYYFEDVELSYRGWKRGLTLGYEPASVVRHRFSSTIGRLAGDRVQVVAQRNRLILHWIHLHDGRFVASHLLWTLILLVTSPLTLKPQFVRGFFGAVARLPAIVARRQDERGRAARSDRDVLNVFALLERRDDVRAYDDPTELDGTRVTFV
jgi:GT2 family glycosyltransferase